MNNKMKTVFALFVLGTLILCGCSNLLSSPTEPVIARIDPTQALTLQFEGARIRVESWNEDYVKISPTIKVRNPFEIKVEGNVITFDYAKHMEKYPNDLDRMIEKFPASKEVYFTIRVPHNTPLEIIAAGVNARDNCLIQSILSKMALVRDCHLAKNFIGEGEILYIRDTRLDGNYSFNYEKVMGWVRHGNGYWSELVY